MSEWESGPNCIIHRSVTNLRVCVGLHYFSSADIAPVRGYDKDPHRGTSGILPQAVGLGCQAAHICGN